MPTIINNNNIKDLVKYYIKYKEKLKIILKHIKNIKYKI
jgi:hypothetical protein